MNYLAEYVDDDSDSEGENESESEDQSNRKRFPLPSFLNQVPVQQPKSKEEDSEGKVRNFPHEPGNWATYVYVPISHSSEFSNYLKELVSYFSPLNLKLVNDFHISLTRTVILRHHWIQDFTTNARKRLLDVPSFKIALSGLRTYKNEERTRTFLSLELQEGREKLKVLVNRLDICLGEYNLRPFHENPSFHLSLLWCPGDKGDDINKLIDSLPLKLKNFEISEDVFHCVCSAGNKRFTFSFC